MICVFCGHEKTSVTDSRPDGDGIRRRRECQDCGRRFSSLERADFGGVSVLKKGGRREDFDIDKLIRGVRKACDKCPVPSGAVEALAQEVATTIAGLNKPAVRSTLIGNMVIERLRVLNEVAYIRFASVYLPLTSLSEIEQEITTFRDSQSRDNASTERQLSLFFDDLPNDPGPPPKRRRRRRSDQTRRNLEPTRLNTPDTGTNSEAKSRKRRVS